MRNKTVLTLLLIAAVIAALFAPVDDEALKIHDAAFERSVGAFAVAKGLNAVISLLQGTEINATPAGVGVTITIGEILDPMNDLVERFSWIMLAASVSLGVQKFLLIFGAMPWLAWSTAAILILWTVTLWVRPLQRRLPVTLLLRLGIVLVLLRFAAPAFVYAEQLAYTSLMQPQYQESLEVLGETRSELDDLATQSKSRAAAGDDEGFLGSLSGSYDRMKGYFDIETRLASLQQTLDDAQKRILELITIFVTLNLLLPLLFLWILLNLLRWAVTGRFESETIRGWLLYGGFEEVERPLS